MVKQYSEVFAIVVFEIMFKIKANYCYLSAATNSSIRIASTVATVATAAASTTTIVYEAAWYY